MQTEINFTVHTHERSALGTAIVQNQAKRLAGNCYALVKFWQSKWYWLDDDDCRNMVGVKNITQRSADLIHRNGIAIEKKLSEGGVMRYRLKCTCHLIGGVKDVRGCYVHDEELKLK